MTTKRTLNVVFLAAIAVLAAVGPAGAQSGGGKARVEGTWDIVISVGDELQLVERVTFAAGKSANEGASVSTNMLDSFACSAAQGVWQRTGRREFAVTHSAFCFDTATTPPGEPFGSITLSEVVTLDESGNNLTGRGAIEFFGPDGTSQGVTPYTVAGTRMAVTPLPAATSPKRLPRWRSE